MAIINVASDLIYSVNFPTKMLFNISAGITKSQSVIEESITVSPEIPHRQFQTQINSGRRIHLFVETPTLLEVSYRAKIEFTPTTSPPAEVVETDVCDLPPDVYRYLNPSRYCESDELAELAQREFGHIAPGHERVQQICDWVNNWLTYSPSSTDSRATAASVLVQRRGVCRDYAHLAISLCRGLGIPARYVSGYAVGLQPPDFHGFFEAYLGETWYLFDPTNLVPLQGLVRIASGTDAAETAFNTIFGSAFLNSMLVSAVEESGSDLCLNLDPIAVSTY